MPRNSRIRTDSQCYIRCLIFIALVSATLAPQPWTQLAHADGLQVSPQEIRDIVQRGIEHNRSPEDIQEDLDGLNQARGGTGRVPLPVDLVTLQTRAGPTTATPAEAERYHRTERALEWALYKDSTRRAWLENERKDSIFWSTWKNEPLLKLVRGMAGFYELWELQSQYEERMASLEADRAAINKRPDRMVLGSAYAEYITYDEAMDAWRTRFSRLARLDYLRDSISSDHINYLQAKIDPEDTLGVTSMIDRPQTKLRRINEYMDNMRESLKTYQDTIPVLRERLTGLEKRARGLGGPRVILPPPDTTTRTPPTDSSSIRTDGDTTGESLDDLLREFADDAEADTATQQTKTVGQEILVDIQTEFDRMEIEFEQCYADFSARLLSLAGISVSEICKNSELAASFSCAEWAYNNCTDAHARAHATLHAAESKTDWRSMGMESEILEADVSAINPMDQITIILLNTKIAAISGDVIAMRDELASAAPGCDADDLLDSDQEPTDWTDDGSDDNRGRGSDDTRPGDDGGSTDPGQQRFEIMGSAKRPTNDTRASCAGGTMTVDVGSVTFPGTVRPNDNITISVPLTWSVTGPGVKDHDILIAVSFLGQDMVEERVGSASGSQNFQFHFSGREANYSMLAQSIMVTVGGGVQCDNDLSDGVGVQIYQTYLLEGQP